MPTASSARLRAASSTPSPVPATRRRGATEGSSGSTVVVSTPTSATAAAKRSSRDKTTPTPTHGSAQPPPGAPKVRKPLAAVANAGPAASSRTVSNPKAAPAMRRARPSAAPPARAPRRIVDSDDDEDDSYTSETRNDGAPDESASAGDVSRVGALPSLPSGKRLPTGVLSRSRLASSGAGLPGARRGAPSSDAAGAPPSSSSNFTDTSTRSRGGVAALARSHGPRRSLGASLGAAAGAAGKAHEAQAKEVVKLNVDSTSFEEWMKMATDNKINATNTWSFALIDYFHDMSLLRSETGDGTINFQKASCTLDGCIKVWTSRVDSVVVETGKLLSGLQDDMDGRARKGRKSGDADADEDDDDNEGQTGTTKKKRNKAKEATLAKSFAQLAVKKLDLEFSVDPLFKKTSADFDEGGAGGLLMNHLGVDGKARIVFDASDVAGVADDAEAEDAADAAADEGAPQPTTQAANEDTVDLTKLRSTLFGHDEAAFAGDGALAALLSQRTVCPTFATFRFAADDTTSFSELMVAADAEQARWQAGIGEEGDLPAYDDDDDDAGGAGDAFFDGGDNDMPPMDDDGDYDIFGALPGAERASADLGANEGEMDDDLAAIMGGNGAAANQAPGERELALAFQGVGVVSAEADDAEQNDGIFDYFDRQLAKNWAGPEHWKMRRGVAAIGAAAGKDAETAAATTAAAKASRKSKEPFVIDFTSEEGAVASKELFESAKGGAGIMLPRPRAGAVQDFYLLPEDRHFSSRELLRLAIKPRAVLNLGRRQGARVAQDNDVDAFAHPADVDEQFWAQAAAAREAGVAAHGAEFEEDNANAFSTQPFYDADDDGAFDVMGDDGPPSGAPAYAYEEDELLPTQALKRTRPEVVNFTKKAKRVDVRRLKDTIWKELAIDVDALSSDEEDDDEGPSTPGRTKPDAKAKRDGPRTFDAVLTGLKRAYPKDKLDEISTSYCFICLLHLANEEGLQLSMQPDGVKRGGSADSLLGSPSAAAAGSSELGGDHMGALFEKMKASGRGVVEDDDDEGMDEDEETLKVGRLDTLLISAAARKE